MQKGRGKKTLLTGAALLRVNADLPTGLLKHVRGGFAARYLGRADHRLEDLFDPGRLEVGEHNLQGSRRTVWWWSAEMTWPGSETRGHNRDDTVGS